MVDLTLHRDKPNSIASVFVTHEVLVRGQSLGRIEIALHRMELASLLALPVSQRIMVPEGQPCIVEIVVKEMKDAGKNRE